jgi:hypothetical protein
VLVLAYNAFNWEYLSFKRIAILVELYIVEIELVSVLNRLMISPKYSVILAKFNDWPHFFAALVSMALKSVCSKMVKANINIVIKENKAVEVDIVLEMLFFNLKSAFLLALEDID